MGPLPRVLSLFDYHRNFVFEALLGVSKSLLGQCLELGLAPGGPYAPSQRSRWAGSLGVVPGAASG